MPQKPKCIGRYSGLGGMIVATSKSDALTLRAVVDGRFGGVLKCGSHGEDGEACALEAASVARGVAWGDDPGLVQLPDLRAINDAYVDDAARTAALVPVLEAVWGWPAWSPERRQRFAVAVAEGTIRRVLPLALEAVGLTAAAVRCRKEGTAAVADAADAAAYAVAVAVADVAVADAVADAAAGAAAGAAAVAGAAGAAAAAVAAAVAARHRVLDVACQVWIDAVGA